MIHLTSLCTQESSPLSIEQIVYNDTEMIVGYTTNKISSYTFSLFNTSGAKVFSKLFTTDLFGKREIIVPLGRLTPGIYFLTLNDEDTSISQAVFIHK